MLFENILFEQASANFLLQDESYREEHYQNTNPRPYKSIIVKEPTKPVLTYLHKNKETHTLHIPMLK